MEIKIAYVGGGSRYWARELMADLACSPRLSGHLHLHDIDRAACERNVEIGNALFGRPDALARFRVSAAPDLEDALRGADFVILSIEPGPTEMRFADLEIPLRYGILQPVGDTTGPGGILRALRAIPLYESFAHAIMRHCSEAWVINYTNPMTLCTAALYAAEPSIKAFGCCHEVFGTQYRVARWISQWFGVPEPARNEVRLDVGGVNHFTWATRATWNGEDLMPRLRQMIGEDGFFASRRQEAQAQKADGRWFACDGLVACDMLRRFGALGAAGDRHLAEFVPWYASSEDELHRWGVVATPYSWRLQRSREEDGPIAKYAEGPLECSGEEGVKQIEALLGLGELTTNVNLPNRGQMPGAPEGAIVETYARFDREGISPIEAAPLPAAAAALVERVIRVQQLTLEAALDRDVSLGFQALLLDPLVRQSADTMWQMFGEMLNHARPMLPGWKFARPSP